MPPSPALSRYAVEWSAGGAHGTVRASWSNVTGVHFGRISRLEVRAVSVIGSAGWLYHGLGGILLKRDSRVHDCSRMEYSSCLRYTPSALHTSRVCSTKSFVRVREVVIVRVIRAGSSGPTGAFGRREHRRGSHRLDCHCFAFTLCRTRWHFLFSRILTFIFV